jgi:poly(ADP-ribose) glycohydrolase ARH3
VDGRLLPDKEEIDLMDRIHIESKFLGGMVGSAVGDAIGEVAFLYPDKDRLGAKVDQLSELRYTDDTAMAIGLAESIIRRGDIDQEHLGKTFSENFEREPWRGYASGPPTIFSLVKQRGVTYSEVAKSLFGGEGSLGNGAAMRIVPLGLFFHNAPELYEHACAASEVTHAHPVGMDGAAVQAFAVAQAVKLEPGKDFPLEKAIRGLVEFARTSPISEKMRLVQEFLFQGVPPSKVADRIGRTVAVHESMPFAIYAFLRHNVSFEECLLCAVLNGGDRDTLGAMAGAISGAYLGVEAIPKSWRHKLENRAYIEHLATTLGKMLH